jgi:hypothetical protein
MQHKHSKHNFFYIQKPPFGMSQLKKLNLKGQIQNENEIGFSYLGHLGVGLI